MAKRTPSGKFRGKVTIGYDPDGKPIYKYVTAPTRRELENVKEAVREHYIFGRAIPRDQPFYEYAGQWYRVKKEPFISNASRSYYKTCFVKHLLPQFGMQHMKAISAAQIQEFVSGFAGASKSQINNVIGTLKAIFASAYAEGVIERDPTVALIRPRASKGTRAQGADPGGDPARAGDDPHPPGGPVSGDSLLSGRPPGRGAGAQVGRLRLCRRSGPHSPGHRLHRLHLFGGHAQDRRRGPLYPRPGGSPKEMLLPKRESADAYVFHTPSGAPLPQASYKRMWSRLMVACGCVTWREIKPGTSRPDDILKQVKPTLTPHYFRHNYVTLLYESGVDPLIAMKIVGHTDYQTTANIYTHLKEETLRRASVNMEKVFADREKREVRKGIERQDRVLGRRDKL